MTELGERWRETFFRIVQQHRNAEPLKAASLEGRLGDWTKALTAVVVDTCAALGWEACGKGHPLPLGAERRSEYLTIDVLAFPAGEGPWRFPIAAIELENSPDEARIAYSLWKVLCLRVALRMVYCYRQSHTERSELLQYLRQNAIAALAPSERAHLQGETLLVVGTREEALTFPYGFFRWYELDRNTGALRSM